MNKYKRQYQRNSENKSYEEYLQDILSARDEEIEKARKSREEQEKITRIFAESVTFFGMGMIGGLPHCFDCASRAGIDGVLKHSDSCPTGLASRWLKEREGK